jgi:DNA repair protein RecO (recombination protein O)
MTTIHKTEALVLERRDYRETSYLLSFFTADFGKIRAQAKGARRRAGKFGTNFLPLGYHTIVFYENKKHGLHIISQADLVEHFGNIDKDIEKFSHAAYFLELVATAMPFEEKNREVFVLIMNFLNFLNKEDTIHNIAQIFEIKFLNLSGFKPRIDCCVHCAGQLLEKSRFSYALGGLLCPDCYHADCKAHALLQGTIATIMHIEKIGLEKIANFKIVSSVRRELEQVLKRFIDFHIGGDFKSLQFLKKIRGEYA